MAWEFPPGLPLHLILDNYDRHPRLPLHFNPTRSSWLNLVARWFRELTAAIQEFLIVYNRYRLPFVCTASAQAILEKVDRCKAILATLG